MRLKVRAYEAGARMIVEVSGEVARHTDRELQQLLQQALDDSSRGVDLDLSGVECLDSSGLNVLLNLRRRALEENKSIRLRAASPAATRLLVLTDTFTLLSQPDPGTPSGPGEPRPGPPEHKPPAGSDPDREDPRIEVVQLRRAMQTRPTIDLARGILMASFGLTAESAWEVMVTVSQNANTKLHRLADQLVTAVDGEPLPDHLRDLMAAAVDGNLAPQTAPLPAAEEPPDRTAVAPP